MSHPADRVLVAVGDPVLIGRLTALAAKRGLELVPAETTTADGAPIAALVELELPRAVERLAAWRRSWPDTLLAASIRLPDQELWHGALAAGADLVANRGAFVQRLAAALEERAAAAGGRARVARLRVALSERPGDGVVGRLPDAPDGSIAVFRVSGQLYAVRDECPHAGASLADGVLEGTVITCPAHGSQFDVIDGSRRRGPSDFPIRTYRVVADDAATFVEVPG